MCACARRHWSGDAHDQDRRSVRSLLAAGNGYGRGTRVEKLGFDRCRDQLDPRPRADPFEITRNPPDDEQRGRSLTLSRAPHLYSTFYLTHRCVRIFLDTSRYESRDSHRESRALFFLSSIRAIGSSHQSRLLTTFDRSIILGDSSRATKIPLFSPFGSRTPENTGVEIECNIL